MPSKVDEQTTDAVTKNSVQVLGEAPNFAMGLVYQFAAHSSGLAMENATISTNLVNNVTNACAASMTALKTAEGNAMSAQQSALAQAYNNQTAAISQALNSQTQATAQGLNAVTSAGATALTAQTSQDIAGITADAVTATAVAMEKIVEKMG